MPRQITTEQLFRESKGPKQLSTEELFSGLPLQQKGPAKVDMGSGESALYGAMQGASAGWSDEAVAAAKAVYDKLAKGKPYGEAYEERVAKEREQLERARKNQASYLAGALGGGVATSLVPGVGWANIGRAATAGGAA